MKKKFKKILSLVTVVTLLVSMLSFWAIPASAVLEGTIITPGDSIVVPYETYYYEVILSGFTPGTYDIPLTISHNHYVIIQSFGARGEHAPAITVLDSEGTETLYASIDGYKRRGHKAQTLIPCNGIWNGDYTLRLTSYTSENMRLSITLVDDNFCDPPINQYEDINLMVDGTFTGRFYEGTAAAVVRYKPNESRDYIVTSMANGFEGARTLVMDPSTTTFYECLAMEGQGSRSVYLSANVTYYVVVYIPIVYTGDGPPLWQLIEYADITVTIF